MSGRVMRDKKIGRREEVRADAERDSEEREGDGLRFARRGSGAEMPERGYEPAISEQSTLRQSRCTRSSIT